MILSSAMLVASTRAGAGTIGDGAPCRFAGRTTLTASFALFADAQAPTPIARGGGGLFDVVLDGLTSDLVTTHVQLHAVSAAKGAPAAIALQGFTDLASFELRTARDLAVVPDHVWIRGHEPIAALGAALGRMQIATPSGEWPSVSVDAACSDVVFGAAPVAAGGRQLLDARLAALGPGHASLLAAEDVAFLDAPGGTIVYRLTREIMSRKPYLDAYERKAGYTHVVYTGTPFLDAWIASDALEEPPSYGFSCGGCGKLVRRRVEITYNQKHIPLVVVASTTLHLAPHGPQVVATLAIGTPLIGREDLDGWLRVELKNKELIAAEGEAFWIRATDVVRVKNRRH